MRVEKVLNNNLVRSRDGSAQEILVMGCGLGFGKKPGDCIDREKIEKIYALQDAQLERQMEELFVDIPLECMQAANAIVDYATVSLGKALNSRLYLNLSDHIHFAMQRYEEGLPIHHMLLTELKHFYSHEYQIGQEALQIIQRTTGVRLPEDEAGFIATHIINAQELQHGEEAHSTQEMVQILRHILNIVRYHFQVELDETSIHYDRFITHLKFFIKRVFSGEVLDENDESFFIMIKDQYREEYACVLKVYEYIRKKYDIQLTNDEIMYLIIHIRRVVMK